MTSEIRPDENGWYNITLVRNSGKVYLHLDERIDGQLYFVTYLCDAETKEKTLIRKILASEVRG